MEPVRLLFLDVDEVLNCKATYLAYHQLTQQEKARYDSEPSYFLNPISLLLIKGLHNLGVHIVLSSSWRLGDTDTFLKLAPFPLHGVTGVVNGTRKDAAGNYVTRGLEVAEYLNTFAMTQPADTEILHAILDDGADFLVGQNLVRVDPNNGMTFSDFERVCQYLRLCPFDLFTKVNGGSNENP